MILQASAYGYKLHDFLLGVSLPDGFFQYQNADRIVAEGIELEVNGRPWDWLEATASYALERSRDDARHPGKLARPAGQAAFCGAFGAKIRPQQRHAVRIHASDAGGKSAKAGLSRRLDSCLQALAAESSIFAWVLRNAFNQNYSDPVALNPIVDSMPQPGRSFFAELIAHQGR